ncbi:hypothetical protein AGRA3207_001368 [Actinomadura graeca]|uniref:Uncharacterized protein n=1 Tax=Actinomadura graeca TaxID=2750812 RepID=A0ABX8QP96_9ACTN|nr:hypothetical protein [Actinomadura graeca]QXJ20620.1 hypothetical protein AGRA3207_001368 [Actinomadura graeca]
MNTPPNKSAPASQLAHPGPWRARWHLTRLALALRCDGWRTRLRIDKTHPRLHVFSRSAPIMGESISIAWGVDAWWYRSSTGEWLTRCTRVNVAVDKVNILLTPLAAAASNPYKDEQARYE